MKKIIVCALFAFFSKQMIAQQHVYLHFTPKVSGNLLTPSTTVQDLQGVDMSVGFFNYYLSNIHLIYDGAQDLDLSDTVFLVKMTDYTLDLGVLNLTTISQVNFGVGVPQALNHLDISMYALDHPLSYQTPSMQWGWTAGYAHMIVDGLGDSNGDNVPDATFELHNLGDASYKSLQLPVVQMQTSLDQIDIYIDCNLDEWIYGQNPGTVGVKHGSAATNVAVMNNVDHRDVFTNSANAGVTELTELTGFVKAYNTTNAIEVSWTELKGASKYVLVDSNGKTVNEGQMNDVAGTISFTDLTSGAYIFTAYTENLDQLNHLKIVR